MPATEYVLWGFHPAMADGIPIKLMFGNLRFVNARAKERKAEGWTTAVYAKGTAPVGLRLLADQAKA